MGSETGAAVVEAGKKAPAFTAKTGRGATVKLADLRGKPVVLYFYPKDNTSGCTVEAQQFQASLAEFEEAGAVVLGVSPDSAKSHCNFADKFELKFDLVVDEDHALAEKFGVWVEKSMYGRKYMGIQRATFLIGPDGIVAKAWPKVKPNGHAADVLEAVKAL